MDSHLDYLTERSQSLEHPLLNSTPQCRIDQSNGRSNRTDGVGLVTCNGYSQWRWNYDRIFTKLNREESHIF